MLALLLQIALHDTTAAPATTPEAPTVWHASASAGGERFDSDQTLWAPWIFTQATVQHRANGTAIGLETQRTRRFGQWDQAYVADVYRSVSARTYVNVRALVTPSAKILPRSDVSAEVYQGLTDGWEASVGGRRMEFITGTTNIASASLARSFDVYYARARASAVLGNGSAGSFSAMLRRSADENRLIEAGANAGREVVNIGALGETDVRSSTGAYARAERYFDRNWGVGATATISSPRDIPSRYGGQVTLLLRW